MGRTRFRRNHPEREGRYRIQGDDAVHQCATEGSSQTPERPMSSRSNKFTTSFCLAAVMMFTACAPALKIRDVRGDLPANYGNLADTSNTANVPWRMFHTDPHLRALIDT